MPPERRSMPTRPGPTSARRRSRPRPIWLRRRELLAGAAALGLAGSIAEPAAAAALAAAKSPLSTDEPPTPLEDITSYNNYYEFGTDKGDPARNAGKLTTQPLDGQDRRPGRQARRLPARGHPRAGDAGGADLPPALRRGLVDGDPLGRLPAGRPAQAGRAAGQRQVRGVRDPGAARRRCPASAGCSSRWTGPMSRACGWTRPCTR